MENPGKQNKVLCNILCNKNNINNINNYHTFRTFGNKIKYTLLKPPNLEWIPRPNEPGSILVRLRTKTSKQNFLYYHLWKRDVMLEWERKLLEIWKWLLPQSLDQSHTKIRNKISLTKQANFTINSLESVNLMHYP